MKKIKTYQIVLMLLSIIMFISFMVIYALFGDSFVNVNSPAIMSSGFGSGSDESVSGVDDISSNVSSRHFNEQDIENIDAMIAEYGEGVSVYFKDIYSGNVYMYNEKEKYFVASLIKAPYCMYLYDLASKGELDLSKKLTFEQKHKQEGTGKLKTMKTPIDFTIRELISYSIIDSDNTAMKILLKEYNYIGYQEYAVRLGVKYPNDVKYVSNGDISAIDAGVYLNAMYDFIETNKYGRELSKDLLLTRNIMITSEHPVARKYGWAALSFHDMGIVYSPHPYVIAILTNHDEGKQSDYKLFRKITNYIEKLQESKYE